jgi:hypothetical protein
VPAVPRHPGSRVVSHTPHFVRDFRKLQTAVRTLRDRTRPETIRFIDADPTRRAPCISAVMANVLEAYVYRSGDTLYVDLAAGTGAGSILEAQLTVPDLSLTGAAVQSASGGTERIIRVQLAMPAAWESGAAYLVYVQGRRVSGADSTTLAALRAWQR